METILVIIITALVVIGTINVHEYLIKYLRQKRRLWRLGWLCELESRGIYKTQKDIWGDHISEEVLWKKER